MLTQQRHSVLQELVRSEQQYTRFLQQIHDIYELPLEQRRDILSGDEHIFIFANLQPIRDVHVGLLRDLELHLSQCELATDYSKNLGQIFLEHSPQFKQYTPYCNQFTSIKANLRELRATRNEFELFLKKTKKQHQVATCGNDLDSLMIMPVQRLARYNLLLAEILKHSNKDSEYDDLERAVATIKQTNDYVNMQILEYNNRIKMETLSNAMSASGCPKEIFNLLGDDRKLLFEHNNVGLESIKSQTQCNDLDMFIFNDLILFMKHVTLPQEEKSFSFTNLIYTTIEEEKKPERELRYENRIHLNVDPFPWIKNIGQDCTFQIITRRDVFIITAPTNEVKQLWMKQIATCLDQFTITSRAKVLTTMQLCPPVIIKHVRQPSPSTPTPRRQASLLDFFSRKSTEEYSYHTHSLIDRTLFPTRDFISDERYFVRDERDLGKYKMKKIVENDVVIKANTTFIDETHEALPDELQFFKGDLMILVERISEDFWLAKKLGMNCDSERKKQIIEASLPNEYEICKQLSTETEISHVVTINEEELIRDKSKELEFNLKVLDSLTTEREGLPRTTSLSSFFRLQLEDEVSFKNLINLPNERDQVGIIPAKFFVEIQANMTLRKIHKLLQTRE